jgi:hypothetical protein
MECEFPTINTDTDRLKTIFENTETIAVVGCSPNPEKDSHKVAKYLLNQGFEMIPIYPKEDVILGQKVYRSLGEIQKPVDMVVVFRKPAIVKEVVAACIEKGGVKTLWTQMGIVNNEAAEIAVKNNIAVVQNRCAMVEHRKLV